MQIQLNKTKLYLKNKEVFNRKIEEEFENESFDEYELLINILKKPKNSRTKKDEIHIKSYLCENIDYFGNLSTKIEESILLKNCSNLNYKYFPTQHKIFSYNDNIKELYIILKGSVKILKLIKVKKSMSLHQYVKYLSNIRNIDKDENKFNRIESYNTNVNRLRLVKIDYDYEQILPGKEINFIIEEEKEIKVLKEGSIFGENSLIKDEKNNETAITCEECDIACMDRGDYAKLQAIEEKKINSTLDKFKIDFPIFKFWNNKNCMNLIKGLSMEKYEKGDLIYKQNDKPEYIYLIKEGILEAFNYTSFNIYEEFIDYIYDSSKSLTKYMDENNIWNEEILEQKFEQAFEEKDYLKFTMKKSSKEVDTEESFDNERNKDEEENEIIKDLINQLEKLNKDMKNLTFKANIQKYNAPQIFGYLEAFELKRRFCSISCYSNKATILKIPILQYFNLIPTNMKNIFLIQKLIFEEKKHLIEQLKNNVISKLNLMKANTIRKEIINIYNSDKNKKGNSNRFKFNKLLKFRNEHDLSFSINQINKSLLQSGEKNNNGIKTERRDIRKREIINLKKRLLNNKYEENKNIMMDNFKNTLINLNKKNFEKIEKLYPKKLTKIIKHSNSNFGYTKHSLSDDNNYIKFLESNNSFMKKTSTKLILNKSMQDLTARNYHIESNIINFNKKSNVNSSNVSFNNKLLLLPSINASQL